MEKPGQGLKSDPSLGSSKWRTPCLHGSQDHAMTWVTHLSTPTLKVRQVPKTQKQSIYSCSTAILISTRMFSACGGAAGLRLLLLGRLTQLLLWPGLNPPRTSGPHTTKARQWHNQALFKDTRRVTHIDDVACEAELSHYPLGPWRPLSPPASIHLHVAKATFPVPTPSMSSGIPGTRFV